MSSTKVLFRRIMPDYDSIKSAETTAHHLAGAALREFHQAYGGLPDSKDKKLVESIILYMIDREHRYSTT